MTLNEFCNRLKSDLRNNESIYKGFVITDLSLPNYERNKKGIYNNCIYIDATHNGQSVKLYVNLSIINKAINDGYNINENVSVDITIDTISIDRNGTILITVSKIIESGTSEQELFIKKLKTYCEDNNIFNRDKKSLPTLVKKIALISTNNTNTLDDIMTNLDYTLEASSFKVQSSSIAIAEQIYLCNNDDFDLILLYRGGHEDKAMNIYSDIPVLEAISKSNIHIGVALGHDIDRPFVYNIADSEYSTPTAFALDINKHNKNVLMDFKNSSNYIKYSLEVAKNKISSELNTLKWDILTPTLNKLNSELSLTMEKIHNASSSTLHTSELLLKDRNSAINTKSLLLISKLQARLKNRANIIGDLSNEIILEYANKKTKITKIILTSIIIIATIIIVYLLVK